MTYSVGYYSGHYPHPLVININWKEDKFPHLKKFDTVEDLREFVQDTPIYRITCDDNDMTLQGWTKPMNWAFLENFVPFDYSNKFWIVLSNYYYQEVNTPNGQIIRDKKKFPKYSDFIRSLNTDIWAKPSNIDSKPILLYSIKENRFTEDIEEFDKYYS